MEACLRPQVSWRFLNDNHQAKNKKNVRIVYNSICASLCVGVCVGYICVLLGVVMWYLVCVYEEICAVRQIWGCLPDVWGAMCCESRDVLLNWILSVQ